MITKLNTHNKRRKLQQEKFQSPQKDHLFVDTFSRGAMYNKCLSTERSDLILWNFTYECTIPKYISGKPRKV